MRKLILFLLVFSTLPAFSATWYVRADGGTLHTANNTSGQCDGLGDNAYPGSGTNQHCAVNDLRWLYDDQVFGDYGHWAIAGGDTVLIRGAASTFGSVSPANRIGIDVQAGGFNFCLGTGNAACPIPPPPNGTSGAHTRILGQNFASCGAGIGPDRTKLTQLFGGWGLGAVLDLSGSQYVDVQCIEFTRHSDCIFFGSPAVPRACNRSYNTEDDFTDDGIHTNNTTANIQLTDMWVHGFLGRGIKGPIGGPVTCLRCDIDTNGGAGWDFDDGSATPMGAGALWTFNYSIIEWSGCNQEYPFVDPIPVASCYSQSTGGYGDAVGTPAGTGLSVSVDHSRFIYNTQDALDLGHVDTGGPYTGSFTNNFFAHNGGSNFVKFDHKFGTLAAPVIVTGNLGIGDGARMAAPITGVPLSFNANLADFCRAGDTFPFNFDTASGSLVANNTIVSYCPQMVDNSCNAVSCTSAKSQLYNNVFLGYAFFGNPCAPSCTSGFANYPTQDYGGTNIGPSMFFYQNGGPGVRDYQNNIYFQTRQTCPTGFDNGTCASPLLAGQPSGNQGTFTYNELDAFGTSAPVQSAWQLAGGSPALAAGITYTQLPSVDTFGNAVSSPPPIGAVNPAGTPTVATPTPGLAPGTYTSTQSVPLSTVTAGATICATVDGSTPTASPAGTCTNGTGGPFTVSVTTTVKAIGTKSGDTDSGVFSGLYTIDPPATPPVSFSGSVKLSGSVTIP